MIDRTSKSGLRLYQLSGTPIPDQPTPARGIPTQIIDTRDYCLIHGFVFIASIEHSRVLPDHGS